MRTPYNPNQSPRVIIIQKLYGNFFNDDKDLKIKNMILITKSLKKVIGLEGYDIKIAKQEII